MKTPTCCPGKPWAPWKPWIKKEKTVLSCAPQQNNKADPPGSFLEWMHKVINIYLPGIIGICLEHFSDLGLVLLRKRAEQLALHIVISKNNGIVRMLYPETDTETTFVLLGNMSNMLLYLISLWSHGSRCSSFSFRTLPVNQTCVIKHHLLSHF